MNDTNRYDMNDLVIAMTSVRILCDDALIPSGPKDVSDATVTEGDAGAKNVNRSSAAAFEISKVEASPRAIGMAAVKAAKAKQEITTKKCMTRPWKAFEPLVVFICVTFFCVFDFI